MNKSVIKKRSFVEWYSTYVAEELRSGKPIYDIKIGLQSANWLITCFILHLFFLRYYL